MALAQNQSQPQAPESEKPESEAPVAEATPAEEQDETVVLSPFEVVADRDQGYAATSSLAGSRLNTRLRDIPSAISVVTPEFLKDTGSTKLQDFLVFTTGTEVAGIGGNFYGGSADDNGYLNRMLANPQTGTRVRGLNTADLTRNFFVTDIPMDAYNTSRVDIQRGPNSILFGLGSPAGIINNTLRDAGLDKFQGEVQLRFGSYGSHREAVRANLPLVPGQLGLLVAGLNDDAEYRQKYTFNRDKRLYGALRWQPKLADRVFTQIDFHGEIGRIKANRPVPTTAADFISNWFGPLNKYLMYDPMSQNGTPVAPDGTLHPELSHYFAGAPGRDWWNGSPATIFQDPTNSVVGNGSLNAYRQRDGSPWGGLSGVTNPNLDEGGQGTWNKNTKAYYANNPAITNLINSFESDTGLTFNGFGAALWPTQMILGGPLAYVDEPMAGPNKREWNDFDTFDLSFTQSYLDGRFGINAAYYRQNYEYGRNSLISSNRVSVDVNATLRDGSANPDVGRPYIVSPSSGNITEVDRDAWRATAFYKFDIGDFVGREHVLSKIFGEQTFTGIVSSQKYENFSRDYTLYAWDSNTLSTPYLGSDSHQDWWGLHYIGDSLLNVASFAAIPAPAIHGVSADRSPGASNNPVLIYNSINETWHTIDANILNWRDDLPSLYRGAARGHDTTDSTAFVWQGKLLNGALVPLFGWRRDKYERWDKPSSVPQGDFGERLPFSPDWNYSDVTPLTADEQRRSWGLVFHANEFLELFGQRLPGGVNVSLTYNDSNSFRPSEVGRTIYGEQIAAPSGETKDYGVLITAFDDKVSLRVNWFETEQKNTTLPVGPSLYWAKAGVARTMNTLAQETWGSWSPDGTQTAPEWLVNTWFFGDSFDSSVANQPLPADWRDQLGTLVNQPLRIRSAAVSGSENYVAQGSINPDTDLPWLAPPLTTDEVEYREAWFAARSDAEWFRPLEANWVAAEQFQKISGDDYRIWGEGPPPGQRLSNDLLSEGLEIELTANPLPNWRLTLNAARIEASRKSIIPDWDPFVEAYEDLWFDGYNDPLDTSALNYWTIDGFADLRHWGGNASYSSAADTFGGRMLQDVYGPYLNAKSGEGRAVSELRKWRVNVVTNYTFDSGALKNVNVGGAVRWQDKTAIGYLPAWDAKAWVTDVGSPYFGPSETNYDLWVGYKRQLSDKITWEVQLNIRDLFADDDLIPIAANPDGTVAQVRIPAETTWALTNTFSF